MLPASGTSQAKQKAFKDRADKFQKDGAVMGADERRNAENDLRKDERELQRQIEELREDLNNRKNEELGKLRDQRAPADRGLCQAGRL